MLVLLAVVASRRTDAGWAAIDSTRAAEFGGRQDAVAAALGVTQQAVSQLLLTVMWAEELAVRPLLARTLAAAQIPPPEPAVEAEPEDRHYGPATSRYLDQVSQCQRRPTVVRWRRHVRARKSLPKCPCRRPSVCGFA